MSFSSEFLADNIVKIFFFFFNLRSLFDYWNLFMFLISLFGSCFCHLHIFLVHSFPCVFLPFFRRLNFFLQVWTYLSIFFIFNFILKHSWLIGIIEKSGLHHIQKAKIMASGPITSWQIGGETMETVANFIFPGSKIIADNDCSHEIKRHLLLGRKTMTDLDSVLKSRHHFADESPCCQS